MGERETHLLASWQRTPKCSFNNLDFQSNICKMDKKRPTTSWKNVKWCFVHTRKKKLRTERYLEKHGRWERRSGDREMKAESTVRCSTLKEAELILDSAVPYTLPESRWNSSNRQMSNEGKRVGGGSHTLRHVWGNGHSKMPKEKCQC